MNDKQKKKRYYNLDEVVWIINLKRSGTVLSIDKDNLSMTVKYDDSGDELVYTGKMWDFDKLKYKEKKMLEVRENEKVSYFSSVNGGVIPTKDDENAGRDCYARLEPKIIDGKEVYEMYIKQFTLAKIPLGFASYLSKDDVISLKHERSSIGSTGVISVSGLIDSTYQGEVTLQIIPLTSDIVITSEVNNIVFDEKTNTHFIPYNKAIAQAVVFQQSKAKDVHIKYEELLTKPSKRGTEGWGSTGK